MPRPGVFLSYSHRDEPVLESLLPYLSALERQGRVTVWSDQQIKGGERWREEIEAALDGASIAVLLISQQFLASDFVRDEELPRILSRQLEGLMTVLPVFISPSTVTSDAIEMTDPKGGTRRIVLTEFQGFGTPRQPLSDLALPEQQHRFVALADRIRELSGDAPAPELPAVSDVLAVVAASRPSVTRVTHIPFPRNRNFTGRDADLQHLHDELASGAPAAVTQALAGLGGIGKTQLALEYSYRHESAYDVLWWIRAEKPDTRLDDIRALGHALEVDKAIESSKILDATIEWLNTHDDWLLVFDNAESADEIRSLLPTSGRGRIIITSRNQVWGSVAKTVRLALWPADDAVRYLSTRTGVDADASAYDVAEALGYLPLALSQAAAYIEQTGCGFGGYLALLKAHPAETLKLRATSSDAEKAIATIWEISFDRVSTANPAAIDLLGLFAFLSPDRIPRALLVEHGDRLPPSIQPTVRDPLQFDAAVGALRRYSLINSTGDSLSVHRLVQSVVRFRLVDEEYRLLSESAKDIEALTANDAGSAVAKDIEALTTNDAGSAVANDGPKQAFKYTAFISYSHKRPDDAWAGWLHRSLESFRVPRPLVARGCLGASAVSFGMWRSYPAAPT